MHSRGARLARGWVVGAFATAVAALSHALAGGGTPGWLALAVGVVFSGLVGTVATGPRPSLARLAIAVTVGQVAFHAAFSYLGTSAASASSSLATAAGHQHTAAMGDMAGMAGAAAPATSALHHADGPLMWVAHALAAVATILFLRHAERALWSLLTRVALRAITPLRSATSATPVAIALPRLAAVTSPPPLSPGIRLLSTLSRRGPPLSPAF